MMADLPWKQRQRQHLASSLLSRDDGGRHIRAGMKRVRCCMMRTSAAMSTASTKINPGAQTQPRRAEKSCR
jgi:hypothetical protein